MTCPTGKVPYDSRRQAKAKARRKSWRDRVYRCGGCGLWHLTSVDASRTELLRAKRST